MSSLTLGLLRELMESLPPMPPLYFLATPRAAHYVHESISAANMAIQTDLNGILNSYIEIIESSYLPAAIDRHVRRSDYRTRKGYLQAKNYWRCQNRRMRRAMDFTFYKISGQIAKAEDDLFTSLFRHPR